MKTKFLMLTLIISLVTISCSKDAEQTDSSTITAEEAGVNAKIDIMNDDVSKVVENQLTSDDGITGRSPQDYLPACATVTRVPAFGTVPEVGTLITKTIDFGTTGCPLPNGNILRGKIIISFTYQPNATTHTINYHFDHFFHNAIRFDGNKTFTRVMGTSTVNPNIHPIVTMNMEITATFPNGAVFVRVGSRVREIIAGYNTPELSDNVYQVTGSWTTTFPNTTVQTSTITSPLIIKLSCSNIVQGIITFERNSHTATLNYGNGDCDNQAVFTINGNSYPITLGN